MIPKIYPISSPVYPQFGFEWHEATQKVWMLPIPGQWIDGVFERDENLNRIQAVCIAEHAEDHGKAFGFVQTWLRGFRRGCETSGRKEWQTYH